MKQLCQQHTASELPAVEGIFNMVPVPAELPPHRPDPATVTGSTGLCHLSVLMDQQEVHTWDSFSLALASA